MGSPLELTFYSLRPNGWDDQKQEIIWANLPYQVKVLSAHEHRGGRLFKVEFGPGHWQMMLYEDLLFFTQKKSIDISDVPQGYAI